MWAMGQGLVDSNPVIGTNLAPEQSRSRMLSLTELAAVWRACDGAEGAYGRIVRLLILTGHRRQEIGSLRWDEIRNNAIVLPPERTKNKRTHAVPLSTAAMALVGPPTGDLYFFGARPYTSWSQGKHRLDAALTLAPWVLHDIRRSVATGMAEIGIQPHIIEAVLNHTSGHRAGVAGIYNHATYDREKRQALDLWAEHVTALVESREPDVVPLRRARAPQAAI
jgi:integrase